MTASKAPDATTLDVTILGREYRVACKPDGRVCSTLPA